MNTTNNNNNNEYVGNREPRDRYNYNSVLLYNMLKATYINMEYARLGIRQFRFVYNNTH